jgi:hypothetical protein
MPRSTINGTAIDLDGKEMILDADQDTTITADTDDQIDFKTGGTDRVVIDSSGKVGVNTTSPLSTFQVRNAGSENGSLRVGGSGASLGLELLYDQSGSTESIIQANPTYTSTSSLLKIRVDGDGNANHLVLDGSGKVGIGTASPSTPLHVVGNNGILVDADGSGDGQIYFGGISGSDRTYFARSSDDFLIWNVASGPIRIGTNNTERMRITSGGNISLGANTASNIETTILMTMTGNGSNADHYYEVGPHYTADTPSFYTINEAGTGVVLSHGNTSWSTHSDERIKENITPLENVLPDIKSVRCVKYNLKGQSDTKIGFIAQDWESKFPEVVQENGEQVIETDGSVSMAENSKSTTSVKIMQYTETIPVLLKAIQELEAKNDALETRINKLEGS